MTNSTATHDSLFLAIDQGGHASRALLFDQQGDVVAENFQNIDTHYPHPNWVEHDPEALIDSINTAVADVLDHINEHQLVVAAGLATQRSSIVCWDKITGEALSPVISWQDTRAAKIVESFASQQSLIRAKSGLFVNAHYGASKMRWCLDNLASVQTAFRQKRLVIGPLASFILHRCLMEKPLLADPANASRTLLMNYQTRQWDDELLALFGIEQSILPTAVANQFNFGHLHFSDHSIPLTICTGDQSAACFAFGPPRADTLYCNAGTGAFIQHTIEDSKQALPDRLLISPVFDNGQSCVQMLEGTVNGAARALDWFAKESAIEDLPNKLLSWQKQTITPGIFLNGIAGLGSPYWQSDFQSHFINADDTAQKGLAVLESIVFLIIQNLNCMNASQANRILLTGGLANQTYFCQSLADLTQLPVVVPELKEATARGIFYLLSKHQQDAQSILSQNYLPEKNPDLNKRYRSWLKAMPAIPLSD